MTKDEEDMALARLLDDARKKHDAWVLSRGSSGKRFSVTKTPELNDALYLIHKLPNDPLTGEPWTPLDLFKADLERATLSLRAIKVDFFGANLRHAKLYIGEEQKSFKFLFADLAYAMIRGYPYKSIESGQLNGANFHNACLCISGIGLRQVFEVRNLATARLPDGRDSLPVFVPNPDKNDKTFPLIRVSSLVLAPGRDGLLRFALDTRPFPFNGASTGEKTISLKDAMKAFFSPEILDETPGTPQGCVDLLNRTPNLSGQTLEPSRIEIISDWRARPEPSPAHP